tara:strand:- start:1107 stop:2153 length:1047 start_codon:yes stop_codon:yes gene_type:complete
MNYKVVFRCDAGHAPEIGTGHIARSKTLANELINSKLLDIEDILFLTRDDDGFNLGKKYLENSGFKYKSFSNNQLKANSESEIEVISNIESKIIFLDRLETSSDLIKGIKKKGNKVVTFDDYGSGREFADLAISSIFDDVSKSKNLLSGYEYLILSKDSYKPLEIRDSIKNIVATFGGNDARDLCSHFIDNIDAIPRKIKIDIILGSVSKEDVIKYNTQIKLKNFSDNIALHIFPKNYHQIISNADIAISSGGLSIFEFSAYGIPTIGLPQYPHQLRTITNLQSSGISILGAEEMKLSDSKFKDAMSRLIDDNSLRKLMALNSRQSIDGNGAKRIRELIEIKFKDVFL